MCNTNKVANIESPVWGEEQEKDFKLRLLRSGLTREHCGNKFRVQACPSYFPISIIDNTSYASKYIDLVRQEYIGEFPVARIIEPLNVTSVESVLELCYNMLSALIYMYQPEYDKLTDVFSEELLNKHFKLVSFKSYEEDNSSINIYCFNNSAYKALICTLGELKQSYGEDFYNELVTGERPEVRKALLDKHMTACLKALQKCEFTPKDKQQIEDLVADMEQKLEEVNQLAKKLEEIADGE